MFLDLKNRQKTSRKQFLSFVVRLAAFVFSIKFTWDQDWQFNKFVIGTFTISSKKRSASKPIMHLLNIFGALIPSSYFE